MKKILYVLLSAFILFGQEVSAQVTIGSGDPPDDSAVLDLKTEKNDKGFLGPRVELISADNQAPITGTMVDGLLVYNTKDSPADIPEKDKLEGNKFYYWKSGRWVQFVEDSDIHEIVSDTINKLGIQRHAIFSLNGNEALANSELGIKNFVQGINIGSGRTLPLIETVNHTDGNVTLLKVTDNHYRIKFKKGTYSIMFVYGFYGNSSASSSCRKSSYFVDFPIENGVDNRARIHSNCPHGTGTRGQHGSSIHYVVNLPQDLDWNVALGLGQASDGGCYGGAGGIGLAGFDLRNNSTFILVSRIGL